MEKTTINMKDVPTIWPVCYLSECPRKEECMRFYIGERVPPTTTRWMSVLPHALKDGHCDHFATISKVTAMRGFGNIFANVQQKDLKAMQGSVMAILEGHSNYYRYRNGERLIMPEQHQAIKALFEAHGYDGNIAYNEEVEVFIFPHDFTK